MTLISELFRFFRAGRITPSDSAFPPSGAAVEPCGCVGSEMDENEVNQTKVIEQKSFASMDDVVASLQQAFLQRIVE